MAVSSPCRISQQWDELLLKYSEVTVSKNGGRPPSWIFKNSKCQQPAGYYAKLRSIASTVVDIWRFFVRQLGFAVHVFESVTEII